MDGRRRAERRAHAVDAVTAVGMTIIVLLAVTIMMWGAMYGARLD